MDVDGVLTNGSIFLHPDGCILKEFNVKDGLGIRLLQDAGIKVAFLSGGEGGSTEIRAKQLGVQNCLVGIKDKSTGIKELQADLNITKEETMYIGDDLNDLVVRPYVDFLVSTADACNELKEQSDILLIKEGGKGAVRELAEIVLKSIGYFKKLSIYGWKDKNY